jgi:hypothetical protein
MEMTMDFDKIGVFYLGRSYDLATRATKDELVLYDSRDLVTHAVCIGMTGSGKTGLCISLIEEAAIDGIPAIVIDPKGDLSNLLLTFPDLRADDFLPWINEEDARRTGVSPEEYARQQAELWKNGLAEWGQDGERIRRLKAAADFVVYTPGSTAGIPVSILKSFACPGPETLGDSEFLRERVATTSTSLLSLLGIEADPIRSRAHILIATILDDAWRKGQDLDLGALIERIQAPPVSRIGVLDLESFYPSKERFELAMALNNLLGAPGFATWLEGEPLDIGSILHTREGKARVAIFSIAHLSDAERMFFVTLLLNQTLGWMRSQPGTGSLRAILYMDEVFGYFPPVANPPSKPPLLTMLKQARAFGLGVVLATQNPVDLDYKGLSNAGTWFLGRLQTERDKARVLEGLEGIAAGAAVKFDRREMEETLAGLGQRVFLMNNVHEDGPTVFHTRWAMSYLRGPITRAQIKTLMDPRRPPIPPAIEGRGPWATTSPPVGSGGTAVARSRPVLPPEIPQFFVPLRGTRPTGGELIYQPKVLGAASVRFADPKASVDTTEELALTATITSEPEPVRWEGAEPIDVAVSDLENAAGEGASFTELPTAAGRPAHYEGWKKDLETWVYQTHKLEVLRSPSLKEFSRLDESERDFRIRLQERARERRDEGVDRLKQKYAVKIAGLQDRIRRADQAVVREKEETSQLKMQTAISLGATVFGAVLGRKAASIGTIGRATTTARGVGRTMRQAGDVNRAQENVGALKGQLTDLEGQLQSEIEALTAATDPLTETLEPVTVRPRKSDISVRMVSLAWVPFWKDSQGSLTPAWK